MPRFGTTAGSKPLSVAAADAPASTRAAAQIVCDGVADQVEINAALTASKHVRLSEGTFNLTDSAVIPQSSTTLEGMGAGTALKITAPIPGKHIVSATGTQATPLSGVTVKSLKVLGYGDNSGGTVDHGVFTTWVNDATIRDIYGQDITFAVVAVNNAQGCTIDSISGRPGVLGAHGGWYLVACSNLSPTDKYAGHAISNLVSFLPEHALSLTHTDYVTVNGITSKNNIEDYVVNLQGCEHVSVANIEGYNAAGLIFVEAWAARNSGHLRFIGGSLRKATTGSNLGAYGVNIVDSPHTVIEDIAADMTGATVGHGMKLSGTCDRSKIRGCTVIDPFDRGIYVENGCDYAEVSGNVVTLAGGRGIEAGTGLGARVVGNHVEGNAGPGIYVASVDYMCALNTAIGNTGDGITLAFADDGMVTQNRCKTNTGWGINVSNSNSERNVVAFNNVRGNTAGALQDLGTTTTATGNVVA